MLFFLFCFFGLFFTEEIQLLVTVRTLSNSVEFFLITSFFKFYPVDIFLHISAVTVLLLEYPLLVQILFASIMD